MITLIPEPNTMTGRVASAGQNKANLSITSRTGSEGEVPLFSLAEVR